jgi:hypothetical protein
MKASARKSVFLAMLAILGLVLVLGQTSAFAQASGQANETADARGLATLLVSGGSFQLVDTATAPCSGQCAVANWLTGACQCPEGFVAVQTARMLVDQGSGDQGTTCGAKLYTCILQQ